MLSKNTYRVQKGEVNFKLVLGSIDIFSDGYCTKFNMVITVLHSYILTVVDMLYVISINIYMIAKKQLMCVKKLCEECKDCIIVMKFKHYE